MHFYSKRGEFTVLKESEYIEIFYYVFIMCPTDKTPPHHPRFCFLRRLEGYHGYGFSLDIRNGIGRHFVLKVEKGSPAQMTGLMAGDRIIEVNNVSVYDVDYNKVLELILENINQTFLLVLSPEADNFFADTKITSAWQDLEYYATPLLTNTEIKKVIWKKGDYIDIIFDTEKDSKEDDKEKSIEENIRNAFNEQLKAKKVNIAKKVGIGLGIGAGVGLLIGAAVTVAIPLAVGSIGFGTGGVVAGSTAAQMMSAAAIANGGSIAAGSSIATLQSIGAAGLAGSTQAALVAGGVLGGAAIGTSSTIFKYMGRGSGYVKL